MAIEITFKDGNASFKGMFDHDLHPSEEEIRAWEIISSVAPGAGLARYSEAYLTGNNGIEHNDFIRFKFSPRAKWFSFFTGNFAKSLLDDPRFASVEKKNLFFWKIQLSSVEDLAQYLDIIQKSYEYTKQSS